MLFRIFLALDCIAAFIALSFFFIGLNDGSVSSFNYGIWVLLLGGIAAVLGLGWALAANGRRGAASGVLALLAIPTFLTGLFFLILIVTQPRWN
jgi:hypothetical protein